MTNQALINDGAVFTLHGVAPRVRPTRFVYRNISDLRTLDRILSNRARFVPLADALSGRGDALTVDDATRAAADAALLARRYGHSVSLFVNPEQVESGEPYSFLLMGALLDRLRARSVRMDDAHYPVRTFGQRDLLRERLKERLRDITMEKERLALIRGLAREWQVEELRVPPFLETLTIRDLKSLLASGVEIQNHGWSHTCHLRLTPEDSSREIATGRHWLKSTLEVDAPYFAVPYGDVMPNAGAPLDCDWWLTVDYHMAQGRVANGVWNRDTLEAPPKRGPIGELRHRMRRSMRILTKRFPVLAALRRVK